MLLSLVRRIYDYETIGGLLAKAIDNAVEKTVLIKILDMLISVIMEIANYFDTDTDTIFEKCINDNEKFNKFINIAAFREVA